MQIKSRLKDYEVILEKDFSFLKNLTLMENAQYVIDSNVYRVYRELFQNIPKDRCYIIEAIEDNKVIDTALEICEKITEIPAKRNVTLVSIGGGIVQDITGFVANITYRGIHWTFVPTTLLAACDSCIGGKTSLNYKKYKNLLGTFYPPEIIYICPEFFFSLTEHDFKSGLGEVVKFNIMAGTTSLQNIEDSINSLLERNPEEIQKFVMSSLQFKKQFIETDEFDCGERIKLNFAHTFGHSIEVVTKYAIPHGTAVAIGMIMADRVSVQRGILDKKIAYRAEKVLLKVIDIDVRTLKAPVEEFIKAMRKDKKQTSINLTAVLLSDYGDSPVLSLVHDIQNEEVEDALSYFIEIYGVK